MTSPGDWVYFAAVDDLDYRAVLALLRVASGKLESYTRAQGWHPVQNVDEAAGHPWLVVWLTHTQALHILDQIGLPIVTSDDATHDATDALEQAFRAAKGQDRSRSITFGTIYVQWIDQGLHVMVELSGNKFLPPHQQLTFEDELRVLSAPMVPPGLVGPNWTYAITTEDQFTKAAAVVVWALVEVFGIKAEAILVALGRTEAVHIAADPMNVSR